MITNNNLDINDQYDIYMTYKENKHLEWCNYYTKLIIQSETPIFHKVKIKSLLYEAYKKECDNIILSCLTLKKKLNNNDDKNICDRCSARKKILNKVYKLLFKEITCYIKYNNNISMFQQLIGLFSNIFIWTDGILISRKRYELYGLGSLSTVDNIINDSVFTCKFSPICNENREWLAITTLNNDKLNKTNEINARRINILTNINKLSTNNNDSSINDTISDDEICDLTILNNSDSLTEDNETYDDTSSTKSQIDYENDS